MPYADTNYYLNEFIGEKLITDEKKLKNYLIRASQKIDVETHNNIVAKGFENLTEFQQKKIKLAVCYQANYYFEHQGEASQIASFGILDLNITMKEKQSIASQKEMSDLSYNELKQTGLAGGIL